MHPPGARTPALPKEAVYKINRLDKTRLKKQIQNEARPCSLSPRVQALGARCLRGAARTGRERLGNPNAGCERVLVHYPARVRPLARGLAAVLMSALPVLLLAGLGAVYHNLAAGTGIEPLPLPVPPLAPPAGLLLALAARGIDSASFSLP